MEKIPKTLKEQNSQELPWIMMLSVADVRKKSLNSDILAELEEWAMNIEEVREALIEWENLSADKKNRVEYEARLKELRDQFSNIRGYHKMGKEEGLKDGREEGRKEGREEESFRIAKNLMNKGFSLSEIAGITGLTEEEIQSI